MKFERVEKEVIGEDPDKEVYEVYEGSGKRMELMFFENSDSFMIHIGSIEGGKRVQGETTELFRLMVEKMQAKANELGRPVTLHFDPVHPTIRAWGLRQAGEVVGGWDVIEYEGRTLKKTFHPTSVTK